MQPHLRFCLSLIALLAHASIAADAQGSPAVPGVHLTLLYINDVHGNLLPFEDENRRSVAGAARPATLVKQIRKEEPGQVCHRALQFPPRMGTFDPATLITAKEFSFLAIAHLMVAEKVAGKVPTNGGF